MKKLTFMAALSLIASISAADFSFFDFEDQPGEIPNSTSTTSLTMTNGGLTMTIYRDSGAGFGVVDTSPFVGSAFDFPTNWGSRSLDPFGDATDDWFVINFSQGINDFYLEFGDFGVEDDNAFLEAYSGLDATGSLVDSNSYIDYTGNMDLDGFAESLFVSNVVANTDGMPIWSVRFRGGSDDFPQSLYWDNFEAGFDPVPEPATMTILGLGVAAMIRRRRKD